MARKQALFSLCVPLTHAFALYLHSLTLLQLLRSCLGSYSTDNLAVGLHTEHQEIAAFRVFRL